MFKKQVLQMQLEENILSLQELWNKMYMEETKIVLKQSHDTLEEAIMMKICNIYS